MNLRIISVALILLIFSKYGFSVSNGSYLSVNDVALEPSGERYWVGTNDAIYQLDAGTHEILQNIEMPGPVKLLDVSPDGQKIAAGGELVDGASPSYYELRCIDGELILSKTGHFKLARPVFSQDSKRFIVIASDDRVVRIYDCQSGMIVMESEPVKQDIYTAAVYQFGSENQFELLYAITEKQEDEFRYCYLYRWDIREKILRGVSGTINLLFGVHKNRLLSNNGTYFSYDSHYTYNVPGSMLHDEVSLWKVMETQNFTTKTSDRFGTMGDVISGISDDESYYWANHSYLTLFVQNINDSSEQWTSYSNWRENETFWAMADFCTIDRKPVILTILHKSADLARFVLIDVETGERLSESPPISEMFQDSAIKSWMQQE